MIYKWDSEVAAVYQRQIHKVRSLWAANPPKWLDEYLESSSLDADIRSNGQVNVSDESPDSIAKQFFVYMPGHSFKVEHLIAHLDTRYTLPLHMKRACFVVVDIGCGGATASTAIINTMMKASAKDTQVLFIGVDTNHYAVQLYDWMMDGYTKVSNLVNHMDYHPIIKGMPEALTYIAEGLHQAKSKWNIPSFNDIWVIQSNVVRPLYDVWKQDLTSRNRLGLNAVRGLVPDDFGEVEARAYEQLLQLSQADRMLILTVATNDFEWRDRASSFGESTIRIFGEKGHKPYASYINPLNSDQPFSVSYENPNESYWRMRHKLKYTGEFYADVKFIESQRFHADRDWQEIISDKNLTLAWARVRAAMIRESLVDEVGLKLFEDNLAKNLQTIRDQLLTYTTRLTDFPRLFYNIPKDENKTRPRALQAMQEELLAVAVIQVLGRNTQNLMTRNFGYRLTMTGDTEYLYRPWFRAYRQFRNTVRKAIRGSDEGGEVLRSDVANFYPSIPQEKLFEVVLENFGITPTSRAPWLLRQLLIRRENNGDKDSGVLQGPLASGFWANLYLLELDHQFSNDYMNASFFRYVDDMVLVISDTNWTNEVLSDLKTHVEKLGLTLSESKTEREPIESASIGYQKDNTLDELEKRSRLLMRGLFFTCSEYHAQIRTYQGIDWWNFVGIYQDCLRELGVFVEASRLSRKIWQYVKSPLLYRKMRYAMPAFDLVVNSRSWAEQFTNDNQGWEAEANSVKQELSELMRMKWAEWKQLKFENFEELEQRERNARLKKCQAVISFTLNRLAWLGYSETLAEIEEIYCEYPYVIKSHRLVLEHLVLQGYAALLDTMWKRLRNSEIQGVPHIRALILRLYRWTEASWNPNIIYTLETIGVDDRSLTDDDFIPEALMATETLIFSHNYHPNDDQGWMFAQQAFRIKDRCPPLARNLFILAQRSKDYTQQYEELWAHLAELYSMSEIYEEPDFSNEVLEPEILREEYYHSHYPDNAEEFEGDYF